MKNNQLKEFSFLKKKVEKLLKHETIVIDKEFAYKSLAYLYLKILPERGIPNDVALCPDGSLLYGWEIPNLEKDRIITIHLQFSMFKNGPIHSCRIKREKI